jgi:hypothetical protein
MQHVSEIIHGRRSYGEKLRDPRWQKLRLERMDRSGFACDRCGDEHNELQIHHKWYLKGYEPWDYRLDQLETLCKSCHQLATSIHKEMKERLSTLRVEQQQLFTQLLSGCVSMSAPVAFACSRPTVDSHFRIPRLQRCYGMAVARNHSICFVGPIDLMDAKGELIVSTDGPLAPCQQEAFSTAWQKCGEQEVTFEVPE